MAKGVPKKGYVPLIIIVVLFLVFYLIGTNIPEQTIREVIKNAGPLGPVVLIFLIWTTNVIAPLGATPFLFAGFYLYGQAVVIYGSAAAVIASVTNFWIARIWGRSIVEKLAGIDSLEKIDSLTSNYGLQALFICRVLLSQFHDIISYAFGLTKLKFLPYFIVSTLGTIPGTILWYYLSTKLNNPLAFTALTLLIAYVSLASYVLWLKITKKNT